MTAPRELDRIGREPMPLLRFAEQQARPRSGALRLYTHGATTENQAYHPRRG